MINYRAYELVFSPLVRSNISCPLASFSPLPHPYRILFEQPSIKKKLTNEYSLKILFLFFLYSRVTVGKRKVTTSLLFYFSFFVLYFLLFLVNVHHSSRFIHSHSPSPPSTHTHTDPFFFSNVRLFSSSSSSCLQTQAKRLKVRVFIEHLLMLI